jgi:hypothetical protein
MFQGLPFFMSLGDFPYAIARDFQQISNIRLHPAIPVQSEYCSVNYLLQQLQGHGLWGNN